ncbi:MAG: hypothetical protein ACREKS_12145, partial [Candidatus Rokuibacteriota bacterium]
SLSSWRASPGCPHALPGQLVTDAIDGTGKTVHNLIDLGPGDAEGGESAMTCPPGNPRTMSPSSMERWATREATLRAGAKSWRVALSATSHDARART